MSGSEEPGSSVDLSQAEDGGSITAMWPISRSVMATSRRWLLLR